ncbi:MAG: hypothetical protein GX137_01595 [Thermoplasmatales archaeon]|jgi:hypothetical protein|nr:hypothetical protein [Thermoplasmatales archaeon]
MLFRKKEEDPAGISRAGLSKWYRALSDKDKVRVKRYAEKAPELPAFEMLLYIAKSAIEDENYDFAADMCGHAVKFADTEMRRFEMNEVLIEALFLAGRWEEAMGLCRKGRDAYVSLKESGRTLPEDLRFRNRTIDILVGHMKDYDSANAALEDFFGIGLISEEDLEYRKNSLRVHRLQMTFDSIYSLSK